MTPKEKAKELMNKMSRETVHIESTKQCSIIAVDEIIKEIYPQDIKRCEYWLEVIKEIENL